MAQHQILVRATLGTISIRSWLKYSIGSSIGLLLIVSIGLSYFNFLGNLWLLSLFHISFVALIGSIFFRPRVDAYTFLVAFLVLGFWGKFMTHLIIDYPFVEPIGAFDGSAGQWNTTIAVVVSAAIGAILFRLSFIACHKKLTKFYNSNDSIRGSILAIPGYSENVWKIWTSGIILALGVYGFNFHFAFFQTGVHPAIVLPFHLNAIIGWCAYCGITLLFALLVECELNRRPERNYVLVWSTCLIGVVGSVSIASRAMTIFLFAAYAVALLMHRQRDFDRLIVTWGLRLPIVMFGTLALSLILVSTFRLHTFMGPVPVSNTAVMSVTVADSVQPKSAPGITESVAPSSPATPQMELTPSNASTMTHEVLRGAIDRWIGLEGVLAIVGSEQMSLDLLKKAIFENPSKGVNSIYQKIANSSYTEVPGFTYLTLAGGVAILFFSGSLYAVLMGVFFIAGLLTALELLAIKFTGSRFFASVLSIYAANSFAQMNFPYLWFTFLFLSFAFIVAVGALRFLLKSRHNFN